MRFKFGLGMLLLFTLVMGTSIGLYVSRLSTEVIDLNDENFDEIVNNSRKPMLVAFTADW